MKKILPIIFSLSLSLGVFSALPNNTYAQSPGLNVGQAQNLDNQWVIDPEVTSIGKNASRSGLLLDWTLRDYDWSYVIPGAASPLLPFWVTIRNFTYAFMFSLVIISAIVMVVTRGRSLTIRRFLPRFILIAVLVTFSFSLIQVIYEVVDIFQGFFVRPGGIPITQKDLLFISWNYEPFTGLRLLGDDNYEAALTTLTFVKLTTFTYYVMVGILLVRKIILWFFIIISPIFALLLMFYPLRNTAKIWIGEFFRWLLYAPLFAIFLAGLVSLWRIGIPLRFDFGTVNQATGIVFPTAVSILLGGPGQTVTQLNNLNIVDTYAQYMVALIMLWGVIIVPWILLQIFLDYFSNVNFENSPVAKQLARYVNKLPVTPPRGSGPPPTPPSETGGGLAQSLPVFKDFKIPTVTGLARSIPTSTSTATSTSISKSIPAMAKISIPTMRDIARYDIERISNLERVSTEASQVTENLRSIANPMLLTNKKDQEEFENRRSQLRTESIKGDQVATNILNVANKYGDQTQDNRVTNINNVVNELANPQVVADRVERERITTAKEKIVSDAALGNVLAKTIVTKLEKNDRVTSLTEVLKELSSQNVSESLLAVKKTLEEKKSKDSLSQKVVSEIENIKEFEKIRESLIGAYSPQSSSEKVREVSTKLHETIVREVTNGNVLATRISSQVERLAKTDSLVKQQEIVTEIREEVLKENKEGNVLAKEILSAIQGLSNLRSFSDIAILEKELENARKEGNPLATQLVAAADRKDLTENEVEEIEKDIQDAKANGDPLAVLLSDLIQRREQSLVKKGPEEALPQVNRIQQVTLDDYESVKKMWTESYQNLEVPGIETDSARANWVKDDIKQISNTIELLSSKDAEKVKEGMEKVSTILPFLLVGGFSQDEVVAYMKAKLEAAKGVVSEIEKKESAEDTKVEVTHVETAPKTMHLEKAVSTNVTNTNTENNYSTVHQESKSPISVTQTSSLVGRDLNILNSLDIKIPRIIDLAHYDSILTLGNNTDSSVSSIEEKMRGLKNPPSMPSAQRNYFAYMRNAMIRESEAGDPVAKALYTATEYQAQKQTEKTPPVTLPPSNAVQEVSLEDYEAIRRDWEEYYEKLDVPSGENGPGSRDSWLRDDIEKITKTINLLTSKDNANVSEGINRLSKLLPFILLGGFSKTELESYLKAKLEAAKAVLKKLEENEQDSDKLPSRSAPSGEKLNLKKEEKLS